MAAPRPRRWGLTHTPPSGTRDPREKRQLTRKSHQVVTTIGWNPKPNGKRYGASRPGNAWVLPRQNAARAAELCMASAPNVRNRGSLTATRPR